MFILLLGVWPINKQRWHYLELVRNAEYQPTSESEIAFRQDVQVIHMYVTLKHPGLQPKQDCSLVGLEELFP